MNLSIRYLLRRWLVPEIEMTAAERQQSEKQVEEFWTVVLTHMQNIAAQGQSQAPTPATPESGTSNEAGTRH